MKIKVYGILGLCLVFPLILGQRSEAGELIQSSSECETVGRVMRSHDQGIKPNSPLCKGGEIRVGDRLKVHVSCFDRPANQWLSGGTYSIDRLCGDRKDIRSDCWLIPCTRTGRKIALLSPQATAVKDLSKVEWESIEDAEYYEVFLTGVNSEYKTETTQTEFEIPGEFPLVPGQVYKFEVLAVGEMSIVAKSVASIRILTEQAIQEIADTLLFIDKMPVSRQEKILLTDALYMSNGMPDAAIQFLETQPKSPVVVQLLADRFAEVGDAVSAKVYYELVTQSTEKNSEEYKFARLMLERIASLEANSRHQ